MRGLHVEVSENDVLEVLERDNPWWNNKADRFFANTLYRPRYVQDESRLFFLSCKADTPVERSLATIRQTGIKKALEWLMRQGDLGVQKKLFVKWKND